MLFFCTLTNVLVNWPVNWFRQGKCCNMITFANIPKNNAALVAFGVKDIGPYYWVGNCKNGIDYYAGQTFKAPVTGRLKRIKLFSSVVYEQSQATLSVHAFDNTSHTFSQKQCESTRYISKGFENQWIDFDLYDVMVKKDEHYAFKLQCKGGGMVAIAECPWNLTDPYTDGVEWTGSSVSTDGTFYREFDLAFEGEIESSLNAQFI